MPTAPWMKGPLLLPPNRVLDLSKTRKKNSPSNGEDDEKKDRSLTDRVSGGRGNKAMRKIVESITKLRETHTPEKPQERAEEFDFQVPLEGVEEDGNSRMPLAKEEGLLRSAAAKMTKWVKVKKAGVTQMVVDEIKLIWKKSELAMLHSGLSGGEEKSLSKISIWKSVDEKTISQVKVKEIFLDKKITGKDGEQKSLPTTIFIEENVDLQSINGSLYEGEADRLLDGLGPRFIDWWMPKPLPVDADLLPEVVPGFRLCSPHVRSKLTDYELTYFRKLARPLPTHFVLGRNTKLQGLAAAIMKLWEKSLIMKIAVKWGIPNTNNEQMAWELKAKYPAKEISRLYIFCKDCVSWQPAEIQCLTGGVNKFFIILPRGKEFLPCRVANLVADRETELKRYQLQEEDAQLKGIESFFATNEPLPNTSSIGTFSEFQDIQTKCGDPSTGNREVEVRFEAEKERLEKELKMQNHKLFILKLKLEKSEKELSKLNSAWRPSEQAADQEMITEEERQCFRKTALKMDRTLVLGRRGVFDGVIGGLHQHWKHREIVKVITMQRSYSQVIYSARLLEIESGGILISVDKLQKGHAIILYRGKNYRRPLKLVPESFLPFHFFIEDFAYQKQRTISDLKFQLKRSGEMARRESQN
ncbi:hypothetical protein HHK36_014945 [Tetracentron sinense]|uniref:CRM domain-containing protein n=1 Tax=Tetracentron sinense TaxID=13715 RepID=A0A835DG99_TETSI|nr:hypothetical protein HHK36_014945 [Tetracentron sinense]